jgi:hypothetical protein
MEIVNSGCCSHGLTVKHKSRAYTAKLSASLKCAWDLEDLYNRIYFWCRIFPHLSIVPIFL